MSPPVPRPPAASELSRYCSSPPDMFSAHRRFHDDQDAQNFVYDAWEAQGVQEKFRLCGKALERFPFSVDAYSCLGDLYQRLWNDLDKAQTVYEHAVTCARLLWPGIEQEAEIPWGEVDNRPFLRSYHGLGVVLSDKGDMQGAVEKFRFLLRMNPNDNQGCRLLIFQALIELGEYREAEQIAEKHSNGRESTECYFRCGFVLMDYYLRHKLGAGSDQHLESTLVQALQNNNFVPQFLLQNDPLPPRPDTASPGGVDEALGYANASLDSWKRIAGSLNWLNELRSRDGPKPDDDGSILFDLLQKGKVVVIVTDQQGGTKTVEVTTLFSKMSGQKLASFKLPVGMKEHDPYNIVCFASGDESQGLLGDKFTSFSYSKVQQVYFWSVLKSSEAFGKEGKKFCSVCYAEDAAFRCGKCQVVWYCSQKCQKDDWKKSGRGLSHKQACENYIKK
jgi:tetratricopeptide (TPR) repeat protein